MASPPDHALAPQSVSVSLLTEILQSRVFASIPGFEPCTSAELHQRVLSLQSSCPADVLQTVATSYHYIRVQVNQAEKSVGLWHLRRRCKLAGLWSNFGHSEFNLVFALIERHSEIIGGDQRLSNLFVDYISPTCKMVRQLMSRNRQCYHAQICMGKSWKYCLKDNATVLEYVQAMKRRHAFSNINSLELHFSPKYSMKNIKDINDALCCAARQSRVEKIILSTESFTDLQRQKFWKWIEKFWTLFQYLPSLKTLVIGSEISDVILKKLLHAGLKMPENLILHTLLKCETHTEYHEIKQLYFNPIFHTLDWDVLSEQMTMFPNIQNLNVAFSFRIHGGGWKMYKQGFCNFIFGLPNLQKLTFCNTFFSNLHHDAFLNYSEQISKYNQILVIKLQDLFVSALRSSKKLKELNFQSFPYTANISVETIRDLNIFLNEVVRCIQDELPLVQVRSISTEKYVNDF